MTSVQYRVTDAVRAAVLQAKANGWSYDEISRATGVNKQTLYDFATGTHASMTGRNIDRLTDWLRMRQPKPKIPPAPQKDPRGQRPAPAKPPDQPDS